MAKKKNRRRKKRTIGTAFLGMAGVVTAFVFMPTTIMLFFAMLPTAAAGISDRLRGETRALTIGAMNLAGCTPFLLKLWSTGHSLENAVDIIIRPETIIMIYSAAAIGWLIDWAMSGIVATLMVQRGESRLIAIKDKQDVLVARWGKEVTGDYVLDAYGFPAEGAEPVLRAAAGGSRDDDDDAL